MRWLWLCVWVIGCGGGGDTSAPPPTPDPFVVGPGQPPLVIAHRGGAALAPENTLVAFDSAQAMGLDVLDMDLCLTRDGILVLSHDLTIERTSDGEGAIADMTADELAAFNFGYDFVALDGTQPYRDAPVPIARFTQVLERYPQASYTIELKDSGALGKAAARQVLVDLAAHPPAGHVMVFSFPEETAIELRAMAPPGISVGSSAADLFNFVSRGEGDPELAAGVLVMPRDVSGLMTETPDVVAAAHREGRAVHYWTVNDPVEMQELVDLGADGIITDRPDLLIEVLASHLPAD